MCSKNRIKFTRYPEFSPDLFKPTCAAKIFQHNPFTIVKLHKYFALDDFMLAQIRK